ncbi:MAG: hypothetical protein AB7N80_01555 [Bdellovibrionales bacterium]
MSISEQWGRWAAAFDQLMDLWPKPTRPLAVVMLKEEPFALYQEGTHLLMGGEWMRSRRQWSTLIATTWVQNTTQGLISLEQFILSEFLVSVVDGQHQLVGLDQSLLDNDQINWATTAQSPQDYCVSIWRRPEELEECHVQQGENFRPLLSRGLWQIYERADWRGRRRLMAWLTGPVARGEEPLLMAKPEQVDSVEWVKSELERWSGKAALSEAALFLQSLSLRLGLQQAERPYVLIESAIPADLSLEFAEALLFQTPDRVLNWVSAVGRLRPPDLDLRPQHAVVVVCRRPNLEQLRDLAQSTVLLIQACDARVLKGWTHLAHRRLKSFIADNPDQPMIWLNVDRLRHTLAQREGGDSTIPLSLKRLRSLSHWREDLWDKASHTFIPRAAVDLVLSHRASRDLL